MKRLLFFATIYVLAICNAQAQMRSILFSKLNVLDATVQNGLKTANGMLSSQQRDLFINMTNYTSFLKDNMKYLMDDANRKLTQHEYEIFMQISSYLVNVDDIISGNTQKIQEVSSSLENAITRLPFAKRNPTTSRVEFPVLTTVQNKTIDVHIHGVLLDDRENYIIFNKKKYTNPVTPTPAHNQYRITLGKDDVFSPDSLNLLEIHLFGKKGLFGKRIEKKFTALFSVVPQKIGTIKITYQYASDSTIYSGLLYSELTATPGSHSWNTAYNQVNKRSGEGWKIDRSSVQVYKLQGAAGGSDCVLDPNHITNISFVAYAAGRCKPGPWAACGQTRCQYSWREYTVQNKTKTKTVSQDINYNDQHVVRFNEKDILLIKSEVIFFDQTRFTTIDPNFTRNFIKFKFERQLAEVSFKP